MGVGPNFVLDKGMLVEGTTAITVGEVLTAGVAEQSVVRATTANTRTVYIAMESVDAATVSTKKCVVQVRPIGIARVISGAAITKGAMVTNDANAKVITQATAGGNVLGIAQSATTAANQWVEVLLTPGATL